MYYMCMNIHRFYGFVWRGESRHPQSKTEQNSTSRPKHEQDSMKWRLSVMGQDFDV